MPDINQSDPNVLIVKDSYFINYDSNATDPTLVGPYLPHEIDKLIFQGFTQVTYWQLDEFRQALFKKRQARLKKSQDQKLKRMLTANKLAKPTKSKGKKTRYFTCDD